MNNNKDKMTYTLAANFSNLVSQLQVQLARVELLNDDLKEQLKAKDDLIKELQHKLDNLKK